MLCIALFVAVAPAYGQSAAQNGYAEPAGSVQQQIGSDPNDSHKAAVSDASSSSNTGGNLPFTGLDIALVVAAGGVLLAMGLGIRRLSRSELA
jgi:hypothetical protein